MPRRVCGVTVRLARSGDVDAILRFAGAVVPPYYAPILGPAGAHEQLAWWTPERLDPAVVAGRVHVAASVERILGVVETGDQAGEQVLWKLYLSPESRGQGLGVALLDRAISALPAGTDHILVEHFAGNTRAGRFYEREGFAVIKVQPAGSSNPDADVVWRRRNL